MNDLRTFCAAYESSVPKVGLTSYAGSGAEAAAVGGDATEHIQACADDDISVAGAANMRQHGRTTPQEASTAANVPENTQEGETTAQPKEHSATNVAIQAISGRRVETNTKKTT